MKPDFINSGLPGKVFSHFSRIPELRHQIFSRHGGKSTGKFASLNVGKNTGDMDNLIMENRRIVHESMGIENFLYVQQVHDTYILVIKAQETGERKLKKILNNIHTADGMITDIKNLGLMIQVADCQAVMLYDPLRQVIANLHSGWRGSVKNIIGHCIDLMQKEFNCLPANILAGISPSLGPCCAEFINYKKELPEYMWQYKGIDQNYFNFWQISRTQLQEKGVPEKNIEIMEICTKCNHKDFFSYRHSNTTGRFVCAMAQI